jgi:hypothetical protein
VQYIVPAHLRSNLEIFARIGRLEAVGAGVPAAVRDEAARILRELPAVPVPEPPPGLGRAERERLERLARQAVKRRGWRPGAEHYPVPPWAARSADRRAYFFARVKYELALREGYRVW